MAQYQNTVYFVSDAHFGVNLPGDDNREQLFIEFLNSIRSNASHLFILGDLFDFWIDYKHALRPDYFIILHELRKLVESGVKVHYLAGNHDFALGSFLRDTAGLEICHDSLDISLHGKSVHLFHGDGIIRRDIGYRILKCLLRNKLNQKIYKLLHPNIGVPLGAFFSGSSRKITSRLLNETILEEYRESAFKLLMEQEYDIVLYAHTHHAELSSFNGKLYCNTGAWLLHHNYVVLKDGELSLWSFGQDASSKKVEPTEVKIGSSVSHES